MEDEILEKARKGDYQYFVERVHEVAQTKHLVDEDGRSLLHNAVTSRNAELVEFLIKNGAENCINSKDEEVHFSLFCTVLTLLDFCSRIGLLCIPQSVWVSTESLKSCSSMKLRSILRLLLAGPLFIMQ